MTRGLHPNSLKNLNTVGSKRGRPKGSRNKKTILQEAIRTQSEELILKHLPEIIIATVEEAKKGNMQAVKLLLDRVIPPKRAVEFSTKDEDGLKVNIVVESLVTHETKEIEEEEDAEFEEIEFTRKADREDKE